MESDSYYGGDEDTELPIQTEKTTKKRMKFGRMSEVSKNLNLQVHTTGEDCRCKQLKCFQIVPEYARTKIIQDFNLMSSVDEQKSHLSGLISVYISIKLIVSIHAPISCLISKYRYVAPA